MIHRNFIPIGLLAAVASVVTAQEAAEGTARETAQAGAFTEAARAAGVDLAQAIAELDAQRKVETEEALKLAKELNGLERELLQVRKEYQESARALNRATLDLDNFRREIETRKKESDYVSVLLTDYMQKFESRLHIAELQRYEDRLDTTELALENTALSPQKVYAAQLSVVEMGLDHIGDVLGGVRFEGRAVDPGSLVDQGTFVVIGPSALFRSQDGSDVGTVVQPADSLEPTIVPFSDPDDTAAAESIVTTATGTFPFDPTLGNAHRVEAATKETFVEHVRKGGPVMIPIFVMAGAALLVALFKWLGMLFVRKPSKKKFQALLQAVASQDEEEAQSRARRISGPVGRMLQAGADHLGEPRDLIEEVMYEKMLTSRLKLNRFLPFVAICAASAPLLGLLGTVTGIINTFKLITVFGSGDVKSLSGGISEALITTKFGLIVAIPSLLLHAFLSRKARGIVGTMETSAVAFVNQVAKTTIGRGHTYSAPPEGPYAPAPAVAAGAAAAGGTASAPATPDPALVRAQVNDILGELLEQVAKDESTPSNSHQDSPSQPA